MGMKPVSLELHIEELVLRGFAPGERYRIGEAVECELARLFAEQGMPQFLIRAGDVESLQAGEPVVSDDGAQATGASIARAIYGGLAQ
jgi:hypothetical protein